MAKRERLFADRSVTLRVNDVLLEYFEDLAKTGLYGNTHEEVAEVVLRHGVQRLIDMGALKLKEHPFARGEGG